MHIKKEQNNFNIAQINTNWTGTLTSMAENWYSIMVKNIINVGASKGQPHHMKSQTVALAGVWKYKD